MEEGVVGGGKVRAWEMEEGGDVQNACFDFEI